MVNRTGRPTPNMQILEEAAQWFVDCRVGDIDANARRQLDLWLRRSPEHLAAYIKMAAIWNEGHALGTDGQWDAEALIRDARGTDAVSNIAPLISKAAARQASGRGRHVNQRRLTFAIATAALAVLASVLIAVHSKAKSYTTGIGEQRTIVLEDGSSVDLNSRSEIKVNYSRDVRAVELVKGQALFEVAKNPARPFIVSSDSMLLRAVGTQFDVNKQSAAIVVSVVEGRVAICTQAAAFANSLKPPTSDSCSSSPNASADNRSAGAAGSPSTPAGWRPPIFVSTGQQLTVTPQTVHMTEHASLVQATAWIQRKFVFDSASLAEVAEQFNRYSERQIIVEDAGSEDLRISGVFSIADSASLLSFLRERNDIRITETNSEIRISRNISAAP